MNKKDPKPCVITNCERQAYAKGLCFNHYTVARRERVRGDDWAASLAAFIKRRNAPAALPNAPQEQENGVEK